MYSVSEVAKKLGVSSTAVYKKVELPEFKDLLIVVDGRKTITEELYHLLESSFRPKASEPKTNLDESLAKVIETLTAQLSMKDNQIQALQDHVVELTRLTENQQILLGNSQRQQEEVKMIDEPKKKRFLFWKW